MKCSVLERLTRLDVEILIPSGPLWRRLSFQSL